MPSQTAAAALIDLYFAVDGAPWCWSTWIDITGIRHGLFHESDDKLPSGWTRQDADDVYSWFIHCRSAKNPDNVAAQMPGKRKWTTFVQGKWETWKIHSIIVKALRECGVHPIQIVANEGAIAGVEWPKSDAYASNAFELIGKSIFGAEGLGQRELFPTNIRRCIAVFTQRSWARIRYQILKDVDKLELLEKDALAAFKRAYATLLYEFFGMLIEPLRYRDRRR